MKRILFTITLLMSILSTHAQFDWVPANEGLPGDASINAFTIDDNGVIYIAANSDASGKIFKSIDNGENWNLINTNGLPGFYSANSIVFVNEKMFIGTGSFGECLYVSTNGGQDWIPSNTGLPANTSINDFTIDGNGIIYIAANSDASGKVFKSIDNGENWNLINTNGLPDLYSSNSILAINEKILLGTGSFGEDIYVSTDDGYSWNPSNTGLPSGSSVNDFDCDDNGDIYIMVNSNQTGFIHKSENGGELWSIITTNGLPSQWSSNCALINEDVMFLSTGSFGNDLYKSAIITSIENQTESLFLKLYPNPTSTQLTLETEQELINTNYTLADQYGRVVLRGVFENTEHSISVEHLSPGVYFLQVENQPGLMQKIVIQ